MFLVVHNLQTHYRTVIENQNVLTLSVKTNKLVTVFLIIILVCIHIPIRVETLIKHCVFKLAFKIVKVKNLKHPNF